jgi:hypothetical protein
VATDSTAWPARSTYIPQAYLPLWRAVRRLVPDPTALDAILRRLHEVLRCWAANQRDSGLAQRQIYAWVLHGDVTAPPPPPPPSQEWLVKELQAVMSDAGVIAACHVLRALHVAFCEGELTLFRITPAGDEIACDVRWCRSPEGQSEILLRPLWERPESLTVGDVLAVREVDLARWLHPPEPASGVAAPEEAASQPEVPSPSPERADRGTDQDRVVAPELDVIAALSRLADLAERGSPISDRQTPEAGDDQAEKQPTAEPVPALSRKRRHPLAPAIITCCQHWTTQNPKGAIQELMAYLRGPRKLDSRKHESVSGCFLAGYQRRTWPSERSIRDMAEECISARPVQNESS